MHRVLALAGIAVLCATSMFASRRIVPLAGHAPGANHTFWTTDVQLSNRSADTELFHLTFHPSGSPAVSRDVSVGGGSSMLLRDVTSPDSFGQPSSTNWIGELEIESPADFDISARTFTGSDDGTFGSVQNGVDPSMFADHGTVTGLVADDRFRSNIGLTNASDDTAHIHIELRRRDGSLIASDDVAVAPHETQQRPAGSFVHGPDDSPMSLSWTADRSAFVVGSIIDNRSGDPTDSPSVAAASDDMFFPLVGKTPGANNTFWTTSISVTNVEDRGGDVTFDFRSNDGSHASRSASLPSRGTFHSDDIFDFLGLSSGSGTLSIRSTVSATSAARIFNSREDGSTLGSELLPQTRTSRSSDVHLHCVRRDDNFRLNVAIAGDDVVDADGTIRLHDEHGAEVESQPFHVPHGTTMQFSIGQTRIQVEAGEVEVETEHGVEVSAIASNIDNRSGDTVMHEPEQENERQQELDIRMSATTAPVGTPITFTAVTPSAPQVSSIAWDFGDGSTASGATVMHAFAKSGEFTITMTVTFASGAVARKVEDVKIGSGDDNTNPGGATAIDFSWSPSSPHAGQAVTFTATTTGAPASGTVIKWHFPDGSRPQGASATFTFASSGKQKVSVEIDQPGKASIQAEKDVTVLP